MRTPLGMVRPRLQVPGHQARTWAVTASTLLAFVLLGPNVLIAQTEVEITDEVACPRCTVTLTPIVTLGDLNDEVALKHDSRLAVDPVRERIYAVQTYVPGSVVMYDFAGDIIGTFGRAGEGPGEFGTSSIGVNLSLDDHGNVHVTEYGRRTVLEPELSGLLLTHPLRTRFDDILVLPDGELLGAATVLRVVLDTHRFVLKDSLGAELDRFQEMPEEPAATMLARSHGEGFWAPHLHEYRIDRCTLDGSIDRTIRRTASWFSPYGLDETGPPFSRPTFGRAFEDEDGRLWTLVRVPAADQETADSILESGSVRLDELDWSSVQDTRIEVLDPQTGELLATFRSERALTLLDGGFVTDRIISPEGLIQFIVYHLSIEMPEELL